MPGPRIFEQVVTERDRQTTTEEQADARTPGHGKKFLLRVKHLVRVLLLALHVPNFPWASLSTLAKDYSPRRQAVEFPHQQNAEEGQETFRSQDL